MRLNRHIALLIPFLVGLSLCSFASDWATAVAGYSKLGSPPYYDDPLAVLGKPTTLIYEPGWPPVPPGTFHCSMVYPAQKTAPDGSKLVTTIKSGGYIIAQFDPPIYDDPQNWYGKDFIVFGNSMFAANGTVTANTNMGTLTLMNGANGSWEPMTVSVSQDGSTWYTYASGPYADDYAPTQSFAWDWVESAWGPELDFTKPVPPNQTKAGFGGKSVAAAIDMYRGSGGGTAFDLGALPIPGDLVTGSKWIRYVRVTADIADDDGFIYEGEVDAFARVGHAAAPVTIGEAKALPTGTRVILTEAVVSAGTFEAGRCCYIEHQDKSGGIRVLGRKLNRGAVVTVYGIVDTVDGERVIKATAVDTAQDPAEVTPLSLSNRSLGGGGFHYDAQQGTGQAGVENGFGLNNIGLLVRTWGAVKSSNSGTKAFTIDDGAGAIVECIAPRNPQNGTDPDAQFTPPASGSYVVVTGISSCEVRSGQLVSVLRLRDRDDLTAVP